MTLRKNGKIVVDPNATGGLGLMMLKDLADPDKATVRVYLGQTAHTTSGIADLQRQGGGMTLRPTDSRHGVIEVHVDPRGGLRLKAPAYVVMAHELFGHGWDFLIRKASSERSAITTESNLLLQLGRPPFRPVPTELDFEW